MKNKKMLKNEKGFTLIEIIAVIIIMGILAAVAVPKFFSMQDDAVKAALNGGLSEAAARFNHAFGKYILDHKTAPNNVAGYLNTVALLGVGAADPLVGTDIGDFVVTWTKTNGSGLDDELTIEVIVADTIGATALAQMAAAGFTKKIVTGVTWGPP
jgi:prepilin-type N-terminal cleavage/methylation domain-containing protein